MLLYLNPRVIQYFKSRESFIVIHNKHLVYKILKDKKIPWSSIKPPGGLFILSMFGEGGANLIKQNTLPVAFLKIKD